MSAVRPRPSTIAKRRPPTRARVPPPPKPQPRTTMFRPAPPKPRRQPVVARIIDDSETSLLDVVDNLLNRGVVLNADVILSLAGVDLVYLQLSALLCAADRILPGRIR